MYLLRFFHRERTVFFLPSDTLFPREKVGSLWLSVYRIFLQNILLSVWERYFLQGKISLYSSRLSNVGNGWRVTGMSHDNFSKIKDSRIFPPVLFSYSCLSILQFYIRSIICNVSTVPHSCKSLFTYFWHEYQLLLWRNPLRSAAKTNPSLSIPCQVLLVTFRNP